MHHRLFRWLRHNTFLSVSSLSVSSLVWMAVSSAPVLAQGESETQAPPAATPQPAASPTAEPPPPQGGAGPAPEQKQEAAPAPRPGGGTVLPETRVVAPV